MDKGTLPLSKNDEASLAPVMQTEHVHAKLVCQGCQRVLPFQKAITEKWKTCSTCGAFLCQTCQTDYETLSENVCPGSKLTGHHQMELIIIPKLLLQDYIISSPSDFKLDPIYKAFYEEFSAQADPFGEIMSLFQKPKKIHNKFEELWDQHHNVLIQKTSAKILRY